MPQPTVDLKITIRTILTTNLNVLDDQGTPVAVSIDVTTVHPDTDTLDIPCVVIEKIDDNVIGRSIGYERVYMGEIFLLSLYAVDLNNQTNIIKAESLLFKMTKEIRRIFNDKTLVLSPATNVIIIKYIGGGEEVLANASPTIWAAAHSVQAEYEI